MTSEESRQQKAEGRDFWSPRKLVIIFLALILMVVVASAVLFDQSVSREQVARFADHLHSLGELWWAPVALIGAFIIVNLTGIPGTPLTLAAGAVWGWLGGGAWVMAAAMIGTAVPYFIARRGAPRAKRFLEKRFGKIYARVEDEGTTGVLIMRLVHLFPFAIISYGSGFAGVRPRDYFVGTFFGTLPGVFIYTYLSDSILQGIVSPGSAMTRIIVAGVLLATLVLTTRIVARRIR